MRTLGNILWHFPRFGFVSAILAFFVGSCLTLTLVASPIGLGLLQYLKFLPAPFSYDQESRASVGKEAASVKSRVNVQAQGHVPLPL
jgi:hypothetical protein